MNRKYKFKYVNAQKGGDLVKTLKDGLGITDTETNFNELVKKYYRSDNPITAFYIQKIIYPLFVLGGIDNEDFLEKILVKLLFMDDTKLDETFISAIHKAKKQYPNRYIDILYNFHYRYDEYDQAVKRLEQVVNQQKQLRDKFYAIAKTANEKNVIDWIYKNKLGYPPGMIESYDGTYAIVYLRSYYINPVFENHSNENIRNLNKMFLNEIIDLIDREATPVTTPATSAATSATPIKSEAPANVLRNIGNSCFIDAVIYFLYRIPNIETKLSKTNPLINAFTKIKSNQITGLSQDVCPINWKIGTQDDADTVIKKYLAVLLGIIPELEIRSSIIKEFIGIDNKIVQCQIENSITVSLVDPLDSKVFFQSVKVFFDTYFKGIKTDIMYDGVKKNITEKQKYNLNGDFIIIAINRGIEINGTPKKINGSIALADDKGILNLTSTPINADCEHNYNGKPDTLIDFTPIAVVLHSSGNNDPFISSEGGHYITLLKYDDKWYEYDDLHPSTTKVNANGTVENIYQDKYTSNSGQKFYATTVLYEKS